MLTMAAGGDGTNVYVLRLGLSERIDACKDRLKRQIPIRDDHREMIRQALVESAAVHRRRDRVVHDEWFRDAADPPPPEPVAQWMRQRISAAGVEQSTVTVAELQAVLDELRRCTMRMIATRFAIASLMGGKDPAPTKWETVRGEFDLLDIGDNWLRGGDGYQLHSAGRRSNDGD